MKIIHPRPNPIVAAMYTLRDMDVDVIVLHGPSGCGFMASRSLEQAGVRVITSALSETDLIFGGSEQLVDTLRAAYEMFHPHSIAVVGTCASMIIGEDMVSSIKRAGIDSIVFPVESHGCMTDNTAGAIKALEAGRDAGIISAGETQRQIGLMKAATEIERDRGLASKVYLKPSSGATKLSVCRKICDVLSSGGRIAVVMNAKKELAYRFSDIFLAMDEARRTLGGSTFFVSNTDVEKGLPRIRKYSEDIMSQLKENNVSVDSVVGGLDEYAVIGGRMKMEVDRFGPDLTVVVGICHAYPGIGEDDILITDQPRQLSNYINAGFHNSVGEISSHSMVMGVDRIITMETAETLRELIRRG
ncbi:MAG: Ni-sirohydrochlorin a,c-diamide reductive cyclase catalytic subunit [Candidatus Methanomethylophilaceae archaeon]|nr:Ni-sirohydrochlorin a,c-diamide reductive cyclase subunit CfbD [Candidatus Methanomethylophilaceae archaeon]